MIFTKNTNLTISQSHACNLKYQLMSKWSGCGCAYVITVLLSVDRWFDYQKGQSGGVREDI